MYVFSTLHFDLISFHSVSSYLPSPCPQLRRNPALLRRPQQRRQDPRHLFHYRSKLCVCSLHALRACGPSRAKVRPRKRRARWHGAASARVHRGFCGGGRRRARQRSPPSFWFRARDVLGKRLRIPCRSKAVSWRAVEEGCVAYQPAGLKDLDGVELVRMNEDLTISLNPRHLHFSASQLCTHNRTLAF